MKKIKILITACFSVLTSTLLNAQVAINDSGANPDASAGLDISFAKKGLLIPRDTLIGVNDGTTITNPANSLLVYNTGVSWGTPGYYYNAGTTVAPNWVRFMIGKEGWMITGNDNITSPTSSYGTTINNNFIGTTNTVDFAFAANNYEKMRIKSDANGNTVRIGIGTDFVTAYPSGLTTTLLHIFDDGTAATDFAQLQLGANKTTADNKVGELNFHASVNTTDRRAASIESYLTGVSAAPNISGDLRFFTNDTVPTTLTERMRITSKGYVGINTTSPTAYLEVQTPSAGGPFLGAKIWNNRGTTGNYALELNVASTAVTNRILSIKGNGTEVASFRGNGRAIIGNTADDPNTLLDIVGGTSGATSKLLTVRSDFIADNTGSGIRLINSTDKLSNVGAEIVGLTLTSANGRSDLLFNVHGGGGAYGGLLERMRLTGEGKLGIGNTNPLATTDIKGFGNSSSTYGLSVRNSSDTYSLLVNDEGNVCVGSLTINWPFEVKKAVTASGGVAKGVNIEQTLTAAANNNKLTALYVKPTFTNGAFTSVDNYGIVVDGAYIKSPNMIYTIPLRQTPYTMSNEAGADLTDCESGIDPDLFDPRGEIQVKLVIRVTSATGTNNFQLRAHNGTTEVYPIVSGDAWTWASTQTGCVVSSPWKDWSGGVSNGWEIHLYGWQSGGGCTFSNAYLLIRPKP